MEPKRMQIEKILADTDETTGRSLSNFSSSNKKCCTCLNPTESLMTLFLALRKS